jgi:hypothetical protein
MMSRVLVSLGWTVAVFVITCIALGFLLATVFFAEGSSPDNRWNSINAVIKAIATALTFVIPAVTFVLGLLGKLPGTITHDARQSRDRANDADEAT